MFGKDQVVQKKTHVTTGYQAQTLLLILLHKKKRWGESEGAIQQLFGNDHDTTAGEQQQCRHRLGRTQVLTVSYHGLYCGPLMNCMSL